VEGLKVADLFAGTGALGIEALSRGAASVTFIDRDPRSIAAIRANLVSAGMVGAESDGDAAVICADVGSWVASTASHFDVVLCDPPYDFTAWEPLVAKLPGELVVLESGVELPSFASWDVLRSRRYGGTIVTVARPERVSEKGVS
jgi:16S rRNA (guanine966-N2)-methyltransferase